MHKLYTKKRDHCFSSVCSFRDDKGNRAVRGDCSIALFLSRLCYQAACLQPHLVQTLPNKKCEHELCHHLPAAEWKQPFDRRPVRAEKGRSGFRQTRRGGICNKTRTLARTAIRFSRYLALNSGVFTLSVSMGEVSKHTLCDVTQPNTKDLGAPEYARHFPIKNWGNTHIWLFFVIKRNKMFLESMRWGRCLLRIHSA